jgi:hypothetical protein
MNKSGMSENNAMTDPTWKMTGTGINPASPLIVVGIPKF